MNYLQVAVISSISIFISLFFVKSNDLLKQRYKNRFYNIGILLIIIIFADTMGYLVEGNTLLSNSAYIYRVIKCIEFSCVVLLISLFTRAIVRNKIYNKIKIYINSIIVINAILNIISLFYPVMFKIDENSYYLRTGFTFLYLIFVAIMLGFLLFSIKSTFVQNRIHNQILLIVLILLVMLGMTIRYVNIKNNCDYLALCFAYFMFYIFYLNSFLKLDETTGLLNQKAFVNYVYNINYSTIVIILDVNNLKRINDNYGHVAGNVYLSKIGDAIYNCYSSIAYCYRCGGDEFAIILKPNMFHKYFLKDFKLNYHLVVEELLNRLDEEIDKLKAENFVLETGIAKGYGVYIPKEEIGDYNDYLPIQSVIKNADDMMYQNKKEMKEQMNLES